MKKLFLLLSACLLMASGCKGGIRSAAAESSPASAAPETSAPETTKSTSDAAFTFDELFKIFSIFGDNIMTAKFAPQSVKDGIKDELKGNFDAYQEFVGPCNQLAHSLFDGNCHDGFLMACYRYAADGHVLVVLSENGGCDVSSVKYIRYYEYDPASGNAHEVQSPLNPEPAQNDFEDMIRLAGTDVQSLRGAMKAGLYDYTFRTDGLKVSLNDPADFDEQVSNGDLVVDYVWNDSEFVRNKDYKYACIHPEGFASIMLGQPAPNFKLGSDPKGYTATYSEGGDLWIISRGGSDGLQVQMEGGKVYSVEIWLPDYCVASYAYQATPGKVQPYVGARIGDCLTFGDDGPQVKMLMDGTVQIEDKIWNSKIAYRTSKDALANPVEPSFNGPVAIENPKFKADARIESILLWRE